MEKIIYKSLKKFGNWTIWLPMNIGILFINIFLLFLCLQNNSFIDTIIFVVVILISTLCIILPYFLTLKVEIKTSNIEIAIKPLYKYRINKNDIISLSLIKVDYLKDFFGIGYKYSKKYGYGFITGNGYCLQIIDNTGKVLNISIADDISEILKTYL
jgi:hypothetical protein